MQFTCDYNGKKHGNVLNISIVAEEIKNEKDTNDAK